MERTDLSLDLMSPGSVASIRLGSFLRDLSLSEMSRDGGVQLQLSGRRPPGSPLAAGEEPSGFLSRRGLSQASLSPAR